MELIKELLKTGDYTLRQDASKVWGLYNKDGRKDFCQSSQGNKGGKQMLKLILAVVAIGAWADVIALLNKMF